MVVGPWGPATLPDTGPDVTSRTISYTRPLSIPIPMSPKQCNVTEVQTASAAEWHRAGN